MVYIGRLATIYYLKEEVAHTVYVEHKEDVLCVFTVCSDVRGALCVYVCVRICGGGTWLFICSATSECLMLLKIW
jgi:hypothetical protein